MLHDHPISFSNPEGFTDPESYYRGNQSGLPGSHEADNSMFLDWPPPNEVESLSMNNFQPPDHWRIQSLHMNNQQMTGGGLMDTRAGGDIEEPQTDNFMTDLLTFDAEPDSRYQSSIANTTVTAIPPPSTPGVPSTWNQSMNNDVMGSIQLTISHGADSEAQDTAHIRRDEGVDSGIQPRRNVPLRMKSGVDQAEAESQAPSSAFDQLMKARAGARSSSRGKPIQGQQRRRSDATNVTLRRRARFTLEQKRKIAETRRMKACSRCHNQKIKVFKFPYKAIASKSL
jgi:hypothetical protein